MVAAEMSSVDQGAAGVRVLPRACADRL